MKIGHILIAGIGVILFLYSYNQRGSYIEVAFFWILGIVLVYLGLKLSQDYKKKNK